jgi:small-conductance mechanosensitive channel
MVLMRYLFLTWVFIFSSALATTPLLPSVERVSPEATAPNPFSLLGEWWRYVDVEHENLSERVEYVKTNTKISTNTANPELKKELNNLLQQINASLDALVSSKSNLIEDPSLLDTDKEYYSIAELESLLAGYHQNKSKQLQLSAVQRDEEAIAKKAELAANETLLIYRDIEGNTERKLKLGLILMANRLSWYLWKVQTPNRVRRSESLAMQLELILKEIEFASARLKVDEEELKQLEQRISKQANLVDNLHSQTIREKDKYTGIIGLDFMSRIQERLLGQKIIKSEVAEKQAEVDLALLKTIKSLAAVGEKNEFINDFNTVDQLRRSKAVSKEITVFSEKWREGTSAERISIRELLSSGYVTDDNEEARKLIDKRIDSVKETVQEITKLERSTFDLDKLISLLEKRLGKTEGWGFKLKSTGGLVFEKTGAKLWNLVNSRLFELSDTPVTTWDLIQAILILVVTFYIARLVQKSLIKFNLSSAGKIPPAIYTLSRVIFYAIIVLGIFIAFSAIGVNFTNLAIVAGALSVGIGFGLQSIVNNFVSGIIILFEHNIKVGDFVELDTGLKGSVRDINVRSTIVNTLDNLDIIVPNSDLVTAKVTNYTLNEPIVRIHVPFGVAYGSDKELVKQAVLEAARKIDITYDDGVNRRPQVWLTGFGDSSLNFELVTWLNPKEGRAAPGSWKALYCWEIETALNTYGIIIPFPQRDLHIKSDFSKDVGDTPLPQVL